MLDLCLVDYMLQTGLVAEVVLHFKLHPTFVSDATIVDYKRSLESWQSSRIDSVSAFGSRLARYEADQKIELAAESFWTSMHSMWEMTPELRRSLNTSNLVILKGDANYRRLLGDRHWDYNTPMKSIVSYFPTTLLILRSFKAQVAAGLPQGIPESLDKIEEDWMTNGDWGVIHFVE
jgi:hypothetical protein